MPDSGSGINRLLNILRKKGSTGQLNKTAGPTGPDWDSGGAKSSVKGGFDSGWKGEGGPGIQFKGGGTGAGGNSGYGRAVKSKKSSKNRGY